MKNYFLIDLDGNLLEQTCKGEIAFDWIFHRPWGAIFVIPKRISHYGEMKCYKQPEFMGDTSVTLDKCLAALR